MYSNLNKTELYEQVNTLLDDYAKFTWDGYDMWENFHAFIINESKGSLKFYNGPSFSNNYTKPQFESASTRLTGVTFNTQQITFTIGVYAVTETEYRKLIYILHPYEIGNLTFAFQPTWRYVVKLAKREDSTRYIVGKNSNGEDLYYSELKLTFEIQGDAVAQSISEISYACDGNAYENHKHSSSVCGFKQSHVIQPYRNTKIDSLKQSDLRTPFELTFAVKPEVNNSTITLSYVLSNSNNPITLFELGLKNLIVEANTIYVFTYNSQTGDLYIQNGDKKEIVSLLTTYTTGSRIISSLTSQTFFMPGVFEDNVDFMNNESNQKYSGGISFTISSNKIVQNNLEVASSTIKLSELEGYGFVAYTRTNLI